MVRHPNGRVSGTAGGGTARRPAMTSKGGNHMASVTIGRREFLRLSGMAGAAAGIGMAGWRRLGSAEEVEHRVALCRD